MQSPLVAPSVTGDETRPILRGEAGVAIVMGVGARLRPWVIDPGLKGAADVGSLRPLRAHDPKIQGRVIMSPIMGRLAEDDARALQAERVTCPFPEM